MLHTASRQVQGAAKLPARATLRCADDVSDVATCAAAAATATVMTTPPAAAGVADDASSIAAGASHLLTASTSLQSSATHTEANGNDAGDVYAPYHAAAATAVAPTQEQAPQQQQQQEQHMQPPRGDVCQPYGGVDAKSGKRGSGSSSSHTMSNGASTPSASAHVAVRRGNTGSSARYAIDDNLVVPLHHSDTNLFFRYLPLDLDDGELRGLFEPYGDVLSAAVMRNIHTGESLGTAFVRFATHEQARAAMRFVLTHPAFLAHHNQQQQQQQHHRSNGSGGSGGHVVVQWARKQHDSTIVGEARQHQRKLFVRNIPTDVTETMLYALVCSYGTVDSITLHADTIPAPYELAHRHAQSDAAAASGKDDGDGSSARATTTTTMPQPPEPMTPTRAQQQQQQQGDGREAMRDEHGGEAQAGATTANAAAGRLTERRLIAFVTFVEEGAAAAACDGVHNTFPFASCSGIPLMAKLAHPHRSRRQQQQQQQAAPSTGVAMSPMPSRRHHVQPLPHPAQVAPPSPSTVALMMTRNDYGDQRDAAAAPMWQQQQQQQQQQQHLSPYVTSAPSPTLSSRGVYDFAALPPPPPPLFAAGGMSSSSSSSMMMMMQPRPHSACSGNKDDDVNGGYYMMSLQQHQHQQQQQHQHQQQQGRHGTAMTTANTPMSRSNSSSNNSQRMPASASGCWSSPAPSLQPRGRLVTHVPPTFMPDGREVDTVSATTSHAYTSHAAAGHAPQSYSNSSNNGSCADGSAYYAAPPPPPPPMPLPLAYDDSTQCTPRHKSLVASPATPPAVACACVNSAATTTTTASVVHATSMPMMSMSQTSQCGYADTDMGGRGNKSASSYGGYAADECANGAPHTRMQAPHEMRTASNADGAPAYTTWTQAPYAYDSSSNGSACYQHSAVNEAAAAAADAATTRMTMRDDAMPMNGAHASSSLLQPRTTYHGHPRSRRVATAPSSSARGYDSDGGAYSGNYAYNNNNGQYYHCYQQQQQQQQQMDSNYTCQRNDNSCAIVDTYRDNGHGVMPPPSSSSSAAAAAAAATTADAAPPAMLTLHNTEDEAAIVESNCHDMRNGRNGQHVSNDAYDSGYNSNNNNNNKATMTSVAGMASGGGSAQKMMQWQAPQTAAVAAQQQQSYKQQQQQQQQQPPAALFEMAYDNNGAYMYNNSGVSGNRLTEQSDGSYNNVAFEAHMLASTSEMWERSCSNFSNSRSCMAALASEQVLSSCAAYALSQRELPLPCATQGSNAHGTAAAANAHGRSASTCSNAAAARSMASMSTHSSARSTCSYRNNPYNLYDAKEIVH